ncbi:MAG: hypothetical protein WD471_00090 [Candidatus Paceibacterota bacterium]
MKFLLKYKNNQKGQILIESIVAISIGVMAVTGVLTMLTSSIGASNDLGQRATGTYLAAEGVEIVKSLIDKNYVNSSAWNAGISSGSFEAEYNSSGLLSNNNRLFYFNPSSGIYSYDDSSGVQTTFRRLIKIHNVDSYHIRVRSTVSWTERGGETNEIMLEDHFYNWRSLLK